MNNSSTYIMQDKKTLYTKKSLKYMKKKQSILSKCQPTNVEKSPSEASIYLPSAIYWQFKAKNDNPQYWGELERQEEKELQEFVEETWPKLLAPNKKSFEK